MTRTTAPLANGTNEGGETTRSGQDLALSQPSNRMNQSIPTNSYSTSFNSTASGSNTANTVPSQTEAREVALLKFMFENYTATQITDKFLKAMEKEGAKPYEQNKFVDGVWQEMEQVIGIVADLENGKINVPRLSVCDLEQLVKRSPGKRLWGSLEQRVLNFEGCFICMIACDLRVHLVDHDDYEALLQHQIHPLNFQQYLGLKYVIGGQKKEVVLQFNAPRQEVCQPAVDIILREVASDDDLIMWTISGSRDYVCAVSPDVLKDAASKEGCIAHFDRCELDAAQASALSGAKAPVALEGCPFDHLLLNHICCAAPKPGSGLKVVFSQLCPQLSALSELVEKRHFEALMFQGIDLVRVYEKHHPKKGKEELVVLIAADLKRLVESASLVGCDICFSETKLEGKSAVEGGAFEGICSSVLVDDNVPIDHIRSMGSKRKESICLSPSFGTSMVDNNENLSSTLNVVDQIPFEEGSRKLKRCKVSSEATE